MIPLNASSPFLLHREERCVKDMYTGAYEIGSDRDASAYLDGLGREGNLRTAQGKTVCVATDGPTMMSSFDKKINDWGKAGSARVCRPRAHAGSVAESGARYAGSHCPPREQLVLTFPPVPFGCSRKRTQRQNSCLGKESPCALEQHGVKTPRVFCKVFTVYSVTFKNEITGSGKSCLH